MQTFIISASEVKGRIDPLFYLGNKKSEKEYSNSNFPLLKFESLGIEIRKGIFNLNSADYTNTGVPFIRISNISEGRMDWSDAVFISKDRNSNEKRTQLYPGDIVFSKIGTIDRVGFLTDEFPVYNMSQNIIGAKLSGFTSNDFNPEYIKTFFQTNFGKKQLLNQATFQVQPKLTLDAIRNILIPIPSMQVQELIVGLIKNSYSIKASKENEAKQLYDSIDGYVLEELGIYYEESNKEKTFTVHFDDIVNDRIDAYYYQSDFLKLTYELKKSKYDSVRLENLISTIINGLDYRDFKETGNVYLKVANIKPNKIDLTKEYYINIESNKISKNISLRKGDLLLTRKGTFGVAVSIKSDVDYIICSEIFKIVPNDINSEYLSILLNSSIGQKQFDRLKIGAIMGSLSQDAVKSVLIPLPPIEVQKKIAHEVSQRIEKADQLLLQASQIVELAKTEVEQILFSN